MGMGPIYREVSRMVEDNEDSSSLIAMLADNIGPFIARFMSYEVESGAKEMCSPLERFLACRCFELVDGTLQFRSAEAIKNTYNCMVGIVRAALLSKIAVTVHWKDEDIRKYLVEIMSST